VNPFRQETVFMDFSCNPWSMWKNLYDTINDGGKQICNGFGHQLVQTGHKYSHNEY
jgi:hypothetical protein